MPKIIKILHGEHLSFFYNHHIKSNLPVNIYYPKKHFPHLPLELFQRRFNKTYKDVRCSLIHEHEGCLLVSLLQSDDDFTGGLK